MGFVRVIFYFLDGMALWKTNSRAEGGSAEKLFYKHWN